VTRRHVQLALGVLWLLDGLLQFQGYMYTHAFVRDALAANAAGQTGAAGRMGSDAGRPGSRRRRSRDARASGDLGGDRPGVWTRLRWAALALGMALALAYWVFGQLLGGSFWSGSSTDVISAPLLALLGACLLDTPSPRWARAAQRLRAAAHQAANLPAASAATAARGTAVAGERTDAGPTGS
jgi:hypothetical protein